MIIINNLSTISSIKDWINLYPHVKKVSVVPVYDQYVYKHVTHVEVYVWVGFWYWFWFGDTFRKKLQLMADAMSPVDQDTRIIVSTKLK